MAAEVGEQAPDTVLEKYRIVRQVGSGGMARVYEALDTRIGRPVAIKVSIVPEGMSSIDEHKEFTRLEREIRAIGRVSHPNIVAIYDVGREGRQHFIVMEWLDGITLSSLLESGPLEPERARDILNQLASAVDTLHTDGLIHGDIKPSNIMVLPDGRVKLMDFGVARHEDDTMMAPPGSLIGSAAYMSPELVKGAPSTAAADVWSLGVLLYMMLTGKRPFEAQNVPSMVYKIVNEDPPMPAEPPGADAVLRRALAKEPDERYPTAGALAAAFASASARPIPVDSAVAAAMFPMPIVAPFEPVVAADDIQKQGGFVAPRLPLGAWIAIAFVLVVTLGSALILHLASGRRIGSPPRSNAASAAPLTSAVVQSTAATKPGAGNQMQPHGRIASPASKTPSPRHVAASPAGHGRFGSHRYHSAHRSWAHRRRMHRERRHSFYNNSWQGNRFIPLAPLPSDPGVGG